MPEIGQIRHSLCFGSLVGAKYRGPLIYTKNGKWVQHSDPNAHYHIFTQCTFNSTNRSLYRDMRDNARYTSFRCGYCRQVGHTQGGAGCIFALTEQTNPLGSMAMRRFSGDTLQDIQDRLIAKQLLQDAWDWVELVWSCSQADGNVGYEIGFTRSEHGRRTEPFVVVYRQGTVSRNYCMCQNCLAMWQKHRRSFSRAIRNRINTFMNESHFIPFDELQPIWTDQSPFVFSIQDIIHPPPILVEEEELDVEQVAEELVAEAEGAEAEVAEAEGAEAEGAEAEGAEGDVAEGEVAAREVKIITDGTCPICMDEMTDLNRAVTKCGHVFCTSCLLKNSGHSKDCAMCRTKLVDYRPLHSKIDELEEELRISRAEVRRLLRRNNRIAQELIAPLA